MTLTRTQAQAFYDRFGRKQDSQTIYEDAALDELIVHGAFGQAEAVFELGFGTGRLALRLLSRHLPPTATYAGIGQSATMTALAAERLAPFAGRARVIQSDGTIRFPLPDRSCDRVVSTYVLDLLSEEDIRAARRDAAGTHIGREALPGEPDLRGDPGIPGPHGALVRAVSAHPLPGGRL